MRVTLLGLFAVLALGAGIYERDGMTIGLGVAAALGAAAAWPTIRLPTFLKIMSELFAVETVVFGLVALAERLGALAGVARRIRAAALSAHRHRAVRRRADAALAHSVRAADDADRRSVLRGATPISLRPPLLGRPLMRAARLRPRLRRSSSFWSTSSRSRWACGSTIFQMAFRQRDPGRRRGAPRRVLAPAHRCFHAAGVRARSPR